MPITGNVTLVVSVQENPGDPREPSGLHLQHHPSHLQLRKRNRC